MEPSSSSASGAPAERRSHDSLSSVSTTSLVFDRLHEEAEKPFARTNMADAARPSRLGRPHKLEEGALDDDSFDERGLFLGPSAAPVHRKPMDRVLRRVLIIAGGIILGAWLVALVLFLASGSYKHASDAKHNPDADTRGSGKPITMDQIQKGFWIPHSQSISWIADPEGHDGLLLEQGAPDKDYLLVEDVRSNQSDNSTLPEDKNAALLAKSRTLMKSPYFSYKGQSHRPDWLKPSPDLKKVLLAVHRVKNWRHSFTAVYFVLDVASATVEPLFPDNDEARIQLATWSPTSDAISFTMANNLYVRILAGQNTVHQVTTDGGPNCFYGVPDWVYEEEIFGDRTATWWSANSNYLAFLRTNETLVKEFPIEYHLSRPSGTRPPEGEEAYPEVRQIKYPKPGSPNPVVDLQFFDLLHNQVFTVDVADFADEDRLINNVLWAGNQVLAKQTNREGDHLKVVLIDVATRSAKTVKDVDVAKIDGGWYEVSHKMTYIPADAARGRPHDGYVDTVIHDDFEHLAYFTPLNSSEPFMLTSGNWEVEDAPSAVDLDNNLVYFVAARESSIQRHVYSVKLGGSDPEPITDVSAEGYYAVSFSDGAGFALLSYQGPGVPYQKVISTPSTPTHYDRTTEDNAELADRARKHELPVIKYGTIDVGGGVSINYQERRPPHFNPSKKHPVLFHQYSGPNSQSVTKRFSVDFQSYVAAALGYVVVTVDPRGTGLLGRKHRVAVRSQLGLLEARDHIAAARHFAARDYVEPARLAIWGWSYGGFTTLKTLEQDAGRTFSYGMAVAPVTDWRFYDSIYTERYMRLSADNAAGYDASTVANASALGQNTRFLLMHGTSDDNVHLQNSLHLLDALNVAGVENYDVQVFPDSDHSISFHNANRIVYDKLNNWLINAFNGEWLKTKDPKPIPSRLRRWLAAPFATTPRRVA